MPFRTRYLSGNRHLSRTPAIGPPGTSRPTAVSTTRWPYETGPSPRENALTTSFAPPKGLAFREWDAIDIVVRLCHTPKRR